MTTMGPKAAATGSRSRKGQSVGVEAGGEMAGPLFLETRRLAPAQSGGEGATRRETAAGDLLAQRRHDAGDLGKPRRAAGKRGAKPRHRIQQPARIGVQRPSE